MVLAVAALILSSEIFTSEINRGGYYIHQVRADMGDQRCLPRVEGGHKVGNDTRGESFLY
jgi:hypothetical protein